MSMMTKMLGAVGLARKSEVTRLMTTLRPDGWYPSGHTGFSDEVVTWRGTLALSTAWACVNLLAGTIASLQILVYRGSASGVADEAPDHPLHRLLHDSPNADQTAVDFWEFVSVSLELWGNAYVRIVRSGGRIVALIPVMPDLMAVRRERSGGLWYRWTDEFGSFDLPAAEVLHIRGFGGSPLGGMSTLSFGRNVFGLAQAIDRSAGGFFKNGMRPTVQLVFPEWLTEEQRTLANDILVEKYMGAANAGRPYVAEGGVKAEAIQMKPDDAQMLQSGARSVEEVCRLFGVPPFMVGHTEKSTSWGTGIEQQTLGFQRFALRRRAKRIEAAIEKQLLTPADRAAGITVGFNFESLLRGDSKARAAYYVAMLNAGVFTINYVRRLEGLPPVDGGDVPRMQAQNIPITEARGIGDNGGPPIDDEDRPPRENPE